MFKTNLQVAVLSILNNQKGAYISDIKESLMIHIKKDYSLGAVITTLDRLDDKGLVNFREGEASLQKGSRKRRYYEITTAGREAITSYTTSNRVITNFA